MTISASYCFAFQTQELPQKLVKYTKETSTGYWLCEFPESRQPGRVVSWYLTLFQGNIVFSGAQPLSCQAFLKTLQRYVPHLRKDTANHAVQHLEQQFTSQNQDAQSTGLLNLFIQLHEQKVMRIEDILKALRLQILSDFDEYLFDGAGQAQFLSVPPSHLQAPISGFAITDLLSEAIERQMSWRKLQTQIPSMKHVPILNSKAIQDKNLTTVQRRRLETLVSSGKALNEIAAALAQDSLELAKVFAKLTRQGLVILEPPPNPDSPTVCVVDDSPLLLKHFENLVTGWGYPVQSFDDPVIALQTIASAAPKIIFLDINMPIINGFDLVKQIRRQPTLASIPLIMLTAEKTLTNNWRAQWSGCKFLSKPLTPKEVPQFQTELHRLLTELVPLQKQPLVGDMSNAVKPMIGLEPV